MLSSLSTDFTAQRYPRCFLNDAFHPNTVRVVGVRPQQNWGKHRRSCPPAFGLLLDLTLALTPALLLDNL